MTAQAVKAEPLPQDLSLVELPQYECHKVVGAAKIKSIDTMSYTYGGAAITPSDPAIPDFMVGEEFLLRCRPSVGGYIVVYEDGYQSFSPPSAFEAGYDLIKGEG